MIAGFNKPRFHEPFIGSHVREVQQWLHGTTYLRGSLEGESARVASASLILARDERLPDDTLQVISTHPVPPHRLDGMIHFHVPDK